MKVKFLLSSRHELSYELHTRLLNPTEVAFRILVLCVDDFVTSSHLVRKHQNFGAGLFFSDLPFPCMGNHPVLVAYKANQIFGDLVKEVQKVFGFKVVVDTKIRYLKNDYVKLFGCSYLDSGEKLSLICMIERFLLFNFDKLPECEALCKKAKN